MSTFFRVAFIIFCSFTIGVLVSAQEQYSPPPTATQPFISAGEQAVMSVRVTLQFELTTNTNDQSTSIKTSNDLISNFENVDFTNYLFNDISSVTSSTTGSFNARITVPTSSVRPGEQGTLSSNIHFYSITGVQSVQVKNELDTLASVGVYHDCDDTKLKFVCNYSNIVYQKSFSPSSSSSNSVKLKLIHVGSAASEQDSPGAAGGSSSDEVCFVDGNCGVSYFIMALCVLMVLLCIRLCCKCVCEVGMDDEDKPNYGCDADGNPIRIDSSGENDNSDNDDNRSNDRQNQKSRPTPIIVSSNRNEDDSKAAQSIIPQRREETHKDSLEKLKAQLRQEILREQEEKQRKQKQRKLSPPEPEPETKVTIPSASESPDVSRIKDGNKDQQEEELSVMRSNPFASPLSGAPPPLKKKENSDDDNELFASGGNRKEKGKNGDDFGFTLDL